MPTYDLPSVVSAWEPAEVETDLSNAEGVEVFEAVEADSTDDVILSLWSEQTR